jgi:hypothetical protein
MAGVRIRTRILSGRLFEFRPCQQVAEPGLKEISLRLVGVRSRLACRRRAPRHGQADSPPVVRSPHAISRSGLQPRPGSGCAATCCNCCRSSQRLHLSGAERSLRPVPIDPRARKLRSTEAAACVSTRRSAHEVAPAGIESKIIETLGKCALNRLVDRNLVGQPDQSPTHINCLARRNPITSR